jgi:hypothetical protein
VVRDIEGVVYELLLLKLLKKDCKDKPIPLLLENTGATSLPVPELKLSNQACTALPIPEVADAETYAELFMFAKKSPIALPIPVSALTVGVVKLEKVAKVFKKFCTDSPTPVVVLRAMAA